MKAVKCPVCEGDGEVEDMGGIGTTQIRKECHGCKGKGWVEVSETEI